MCPSVQNKGNLLVGNLVLWVEQNASEVVELFSFGICLFHLPTSLRRERISRGDGSGLKCWRLEARQLG